MMPGFSMVGGGPVGMLPTTTQTTTQPGGTPVNYTPSAARTVKVQPSSQAFTATGNFWDMSNPKKPRGLKDPNSTIDVSIDWNDWLADVNDTAASYSWTLTNGATQVAANAANEGTAGVSTLFLSLGTLGSVVEATCRMTTNSVPPRTEDRTVLLTIEDR